MTWLKLNRDLSTREDLKTEFPPSAQTLNACAPDEPQYPHHNSMPVCFIPESLHHWLLATSFSALPQTKKKKENHVTLLHILTPFCQSCPHADEIYFWLGEENLQAINPEMVVMGVAVMRCITYLMQDAVTRFRGRNCSLGEGCLLLLSSLCIEKGHPVCCTSFLKFII